VGIILAKTRLFEAQSHSSSRFTAKRKGKLNRLPTASFQLFTHPRPSLDTRRIQTCQLKVCLCHGARGEGYVADKAPALGNQDFLVSVNDEFLRRAIANGRPGTPRRRAHRSELIVVAQIGANDLYDILIEVLVGLSD